MMELTSLETTTPQWSVQDVISTFAPNHLTTVSGLECSSADATALAQTIQSILAAPESSVLASQMQLMQAVAGNQSGGNQVMLMPPSEALPWMMQQYPMMFLPSQVVPGWTQSAAQSSSETANTTTLTSKETAPATQLPLYAQAVQLQFPDGLNMAAHQTSAEFPNSTSVVASPAPKLSTSNSPVPVGITMTPQTFQLVNGAIGIAQQPSQIHATQQPVTQTDSVAYTLPAGYTITQQEPSKVELPKPPKKPLSPYMSFSKAIWSQVKGANPSMSVCEVGAAIGRLWRELDEHEKQRYNNAFTNDKARYDQELQSYLKVTGLQASDLVKPRAKKNHKPSASVSQQSRPVVGAAVSMTQPQQRPQAPNETVISGGAAETSAVTELARALPHFSQVWTGQQQYIDQQVLAQLFANCDGTINLVGVQPQAVNVGDENNRQQLAVIYGQNQELTQPAANTGQLTTLEKAAVASATSGGNVGGQTGTTIPWQWHQVQIEDPPSSGQLILSDDQNLARTLLSKMETDAKPSDAGIAIISTPSQSSSAVGIANGSESSETDLAKWKQLQPAVRESLLEKELLQMRGALSEKTQEAQILMQRLEQANRIIEQLRQQRRTLLGQDGAAVAAANCKTTESGAN